MKNSCFIGAGALLLWFSACPLFLWGASAEGQQETTDTLFAQYEKIQKNLTQSLKELSEIQEEIAAEKLPLSRQLGLKEEQLSKTRSAYEDLSGKLDSRNMDLNHLRTQIDDLSQQKTYISNLLGEYLRSLETQLHIAEAQTYGERIKEAQLALANEKLEASEVFETQLAAVRASIDRIEGLNGGVRFWGQAVGKGGAVMEGQFALIGPAAYFTAKDGKTAGYVLELLGSAKPNVISFEDEEKGMSFEAVKRLNPFGGRDGAKTPDFTILTQNTLHSGKGLLPIDPTMGDAHKLAQTNDTLWEHIKKGGPVMIPILALALLALILATIKWIQLARIKMPLPQSLTSLLSDIGERAIMEGRRKAALVKGPAGEMMQKAVDHLNQPKELIEEVMYERILETRTRLNRTLPFIAVCASSGPLLGLLGTVTGIINTFKLITAFGSGDIKTLSSGISEALITTEYGLIVAIPSLLLHAFLNRKAKSLIDCMERIAVAVMNQLTKASVEESRETAQIEAFTKKPQKGGYS